MSIIDKSDRWCCSGYEIGLRWMKAARRVPNIRPGRMSGLALLAVMAGMINVTSIACSGAAAPEAAAQPAATAATEAATSIPTSTSTVTAVEAQSSPTPAPSPTIPVAQETIAASPIAEHAAVPTPTQGLEATPTSVKTPATATPATAPTEATTSAVAATTPESSTGSQKEQILTTSHLVERSPEFEKGQLSEGVTISGEALRLADREAGQEVTGEYLSQVWETEFPFNDAVLSWNAETPKGTLARFDLRVRSGRQWSGWYGMGEWSSQGGRSLGGSADALGAVNIDTLKLNQPADALQYRVILKSSTPGETPIVRQISVVYADLSRGLIGPQLSRPEGGARDLDVPQRSQLDEDPSVARTICSPTSLAMVLQYWGLEKSVAEVYAGVRDRTTGIYGNWPLNTAYAGANGFRARVDRFYSVVQLEQEIAAGRPVIVSVAYGAGELAGAAAPSTDGHLIVVRGFTADGDVIVNDPIAPSSRSVRLVYNREQFQKVWLRSGGIVYLVQPAA
ncbi:MAG: peptidase C39 family protein [Chloroflexota bacterium]|jgi:hypothetical protein